MPKMMHITSAAVLLLSCTSASPLPNPPGFTPGMQSQMDAMIATEVAGLTAERENSMPTTKSNFAQAGIKAPVESVFAPANPWDILEQPLAQAAMDKMRSNYVSLGGPDLTGEDIPVVYAEPINAANRATGVPVDLLVHIIWNESKGHPLVPNGGLMQIDDDVQWGLMKDKNPALMSRYNVADNIMAGAMVMAAKCITIPSTASEGQWWDTYNGPYKGGA
ncbi:Hypothetical predicted protein [Lecanosticta acicola]|uniref:Transglycosylase SLT domain-containing protein n=1 Tax=Lecanosticta acicola TaxID=111012 RepID=A0AAI8Z3R1_9PEZI|nr:Hypothetical predicted protein [Lecanosticta acicola]